MQPLVRWIEWKGPISMTLGGWLQNITISGMAIVPMPGCNFLFVLHSCASAEDVLGRLWDDTSMERVLFSCTIARGWIHISVRSRKVFVRQYISWCHASCSRLNGGGSWTRSGARNSVEVYLRWRVELHKQSPDFEMFRNFLGFSFGDV